MQGFRVQVLCGFSCKHVEFLPSPVVRTKNFMKIVPKMSHTRAGVANREPLKFLVVKSFPLITLPQTS